MELSVRRNIDRFPNDFMFELSEDEMTILVSQNVTPTIQHFVGANLSAED